MQFEEFNGVQVCESAKEVIYDAEQHNMILFFSERSFIILGGGGRASSECVECFR
jgi:hypothetical protein